MRIWALCLVSAVVALAHNSAAYAGLETNGSFEVGHFVPDGNDTMSLQPGAVDMTGWIVFQAELAWIGPTNPFGVVASAGDYSLDLAGYHDSVPYGGVTQILATSAGNVYHLSFDVGANTRASNSNSAVTATAGGTTNTYSATATNGQTWVSVGFDFTATGPFTTINLSGSNLFNTNYVGLDNVEVTLIRSVPEPSGATLLVAGAVCCLAAIRRERGRGRKVRD